MTEKNWLLTPHALGMLAMFAIAFLYTQAAPDFSPAASDVENVSS